MTLFARWFSLVVLLVCTGCASFDREWRGAAAADDAFSGRWEGQWKSVKHRGSGGRLRCVLVKADAAAPEKDGSVPYLAHFHARWLLFSSSYTATLQGRRIDGELRLSGAHHLAGIGGGLYRYEGRVTPRRFTATYGSSYDDGNFEMTRASR